MTPRVGSLGALVPQRGFSRLRWAREAAGTATWVSHDGLVVVSGLHQASLPGSGDPPLVGPSWLVSVSRRAGGLDERCRVTDADVLRVVTAFGMPAFDEDNHHPGVARHLWCPVAPAYQQACECKLTEVVVHDGMYTWTNDRTEPCRGCEYETMFGLPCTIHHAA